MTDVTLSIPQPLFNELAAEATTDFEEETFANDNAAVVHAIKQMMKPSHRRHAAQGVSKAAFNAAMASASAAQANANSAGTTVKANQQTARNDADVEIDTIT